MRTLLPAARTAGLLFLLAAPLMSLPAQGEAPATPQVAFEQYRLANGLTVILHEDRSAPVAAVVVMFHVGSKNERPGRTGFAHLFEHMMFQGSQHVADNEHFKLLQEVGANINGTTNIDRTNYFETVPSNALELALYLEADRMGFLLPAMTQQKLDNQRDVVKNERRQNYENQPYGLAGEKLDKALYPEGHPYSWPTIGSMADLSAAALEDVKDFFRTYYAPNNAVLVVSGDFETARTRGWIEKYFGPIPSGPPFERPKTWTFALAEEKRMVMEDRVQLPRLYITWPSQPMNTRADAVGDILTDILASGKNSRLYRRLVYEKQIAQNVSAYQGGAEIAGELGIQVTAKQGVPLTDIESEVRTLLEDLIRDGVTEREVQAALNNKEVQLVTNKTTVFGKANALATYHTLTGDARNINREFDRFAGITAAEIQDLARSIFTSNGVVLSVVPNGKTDLAAQQRAVPRREVIE